MGGNFKKENIFLFLNEKATKANIVNTFNNISERAEKNDLIFLFFSTHGTSPNKDGGVCFVTYDSIVKTRESAWQSSISGKILKDFISGVRAKRLVILMDACHSNGAFSKIEGFLPTGGKSLGVLDANEEGYGASTLFKVEKILGAKDIVLDDEPEQATKQSPSVSDWGKIVISASNDNEQSFESETFKHGFFTYFFIEGLKKYGNVKDAFSYAKPVIKESVWQERQQHQNPQAMADRKESNISFR